MIYDLLDSSFIFIQDWFSALEFEKDDFSQISFWESVKYDIVTSFSDEYHIFWSVWKIGKCWKYFLVYFAEDTISRSLYCFTSDSLSLMEWEDFHDKNPDHKTEESAEDESYYIHILFFAFL